ncbi:MAG TPA: hypothetical protein VME46_03795 [Acidimicrobiales bacterium]|nr:hypothetical protein [Acidimicrobiales bacterium]
MLTPKRGRSPAAPYWSTALVAMSLGATMFAVACSGGSDPVSVAHIGSMPTTTATVAGKADALKYSECMRAHGVPDFPYPNAQGQLQAKGAPSSDLDPSSPEFQRAAKDCQQYEPVMSPAQQARALAQALEFSKCMRAHGISGFPDPQTVNGGIGILIHAGQGSGNLGPSSPQFQQAMQACQSLMPGKVQKAGLAPPHVQSPAPAAN